MSAGKHLNEALAAEAEAYRALLDGRPADAPLARARDAYTASHAETGPRSWGRLVGALKMAILLGDARELAIQAADDAAGVDMPAAAYAAALAAVVLDRPPEVDSLVAEGGSFERTGRALDALARRDEAAYRRALAAVLADFEARDQHLTGIAFADTAAVLERLAEQRGIAVHPRSALLPA